ncbi:MAG: recombinase family protein, partial [Chloroflexi bacterium]|nr:recombinase family protein [Chloroflexota bacterium]
VPIRNRALVYIRKSVVRNATDAVSPERQRQACLAEAERHGWIVEQADVYADAEGHQSGRNDGRPDWQRLRRRVRHDESVAAVIVESLSRASRSVRAFFEFVEELRARGVGLVSLKERFDTSNAMGQAMLGFIAVVNQLESDLASERMSMNIRFKRRAGRHWGRTPFGCQREAVTGALLPSEETYTLDGESRRYHDALRRAYELYTEDNLGYKRLAVALNAEGWRFRGRDGAPRRWDANNTRSVLMLYRLYAGWLPVEGHNKDVALHPERVEWVEANYEPVLPPALCQRVGATLSKRTVVWRPASEGKARRYVYDYTLTGLLHCASCGDRLKGYTARGRRRYRHFLRGSCPETWSDAETLEGDALALLDAMVLPEEIVDELGDLLLDTFGAVMDEGVQEEWDRVTRSIQRLEGEIDRLVDLALAGDLDVGAQARALRTRNAEIEALRTRQGELERQAAGERRDIEHVLSQLRAIQSLARSAAPDRQKNLLRTVFERLEASGGHITRWTPRAWCKQFF